MSHKPDDVTAKDAGGDFTPHSDGQHAVFCVDVVDLGKKIEQFPGTPPRAVPKVALVFASGERQEKPTSDGKHLLKIVTVEMTLSANEKSNLRQFLESWRGKSYTPEQAEAGLPISKLFSQPALISIEHKITRKNRRFAKVTSIAPLPKVMPAPDEAVLEEYERPKFLTDRKAEYAAAVAKHAASQPSEGEFPDAPPDDDASDDLPF